MTNLRISATTVKYFFQYRCERQVRYRMMPLEALSEIPIQVADEDQAPWARAGNEYEEGVINALAQKQSILLPPPKEKLSAAESLDFLTRTQGEMYAHQLRLEMPPIDSLPEAFRDRWGLPDSVNLSPGFPDLLEAVVSNGAVVGFKLIDIKAVQHATLFHKAQVAYYAMLLEAMLATNGINTPVYPLAEIWHAVPGGAGDLPERRAFRLAGYKAQVMDFFRRVVPRLPEVPVEKGRDETRFHVYFKCEQCPYLPHCSKVVAPDVAPDALDLSAVAGMSRQTKLTLMTMGINTVSKLAGQAMEGEGGIQRHPKANWGLKFGGDILVERARAIASGRVTRMAERYTHQMPRGFELGIYLVVDQDPVEGRLAALGCRCVWAGKPSQTLIEPVTAEGPQAELAALRKVLGMVVGMLDAADLANRADPASGVRAHLFLYEMSEAKDLAAALGRHLNDAGVRDSLLHMLRMFPPEQLPPEPEYKGAQHLPATALRSVIDALFALPIRVSHDLRSVTQALANATPPLDCPYHPGERFRRPFSSRLNVDACRDLKSGKLAGATVCSDIDSRLAAMESLSAWLVARNAEEGSSFLRLDKPPFRWQVSLNPLKPHDLDLLRAHELLQFRTAELQALISLAAPWQTRRDRLKCFANLRLTDIKRNPSPLVRFRLRFTVPAASRRVELEPGAVGLILTNDDPNLRLDPLAWQRVFVNLFRIDRHDEELNLLIDVEDADSIWERLLHDTPADCWFLDQAHRHLNASKMDAFLHYLSGAEAGGPAGHGAQGGAS